MKQQSGFTIIELVVVIILLGIMAATALPRFMDVSTEAHASVVDGVQGGLQSGMALYRAEWIAEGQADASTADPDWGGLRVTAGGYPYGLVDNSVTRDDIVNTADCSAIFSNVLQAGAPSITAVAAVANVVDVGTDFATHVNNTDDCLYYYTAETSSSGSTVPTLAYDSETGQISLSTAALP